MGPALTRSQGLHSLTQLGVDHRDVSIGNVLLGTDPEKPAGFISDLDLSSISEEAIKAAYPNDYDTIIKQMKDGEWRTVRGYLEVARTAFSYTLCAQGTALFMSNDLLAALVPIKRSHGRPATSEFTFRPRLCHDFESLIWVVVYAMMIHQRSVLASTDPAMSELYKQDLNDFWAVHSYKSVRRSHNDMIGIGCSFTCLSTVRSWFPDPCEVTFFRDAMRLLRNQAHDGEPITYEGLCALFRKHINLAKEPQAFDDVSK